MKTVVVGVGNPYRRDDAVGLEVCRLVAAADTPGVEVVEHDGEPAGLVNIWSECDVSYVVDALRSAGQPGRVHRLEVGDRALPDRPERDSSHALGLGDAVELARVLGRLPGRLVIVGIEGLGFEAGLGLTPEVAAAAHRVAGEILAELAATGAPRCA